MCLRWYILTGKHPDLSKVCQYAFGQQVCVQRTKAESGGRFTTKSVTAISVGSTIAKNGSALVYFPDRHGRKIVFLD